MIVQLVLKGLFLYFVFLVIRSLFRGASQVNQMKDFLRDAQRSQGSGQGRQGGAGQDRPSSKSNDDVVEAEFRRL